MRYALVTEVVGVVRSLGDVGIRSIVAGEYASSPVFWSRHCAGRVVLPNMREEEAEALDLLMDAGRRQRFPPVVMTGRESDVLLFSRNRQRLSECFLLKLPDAGTMEILSDKWAFARLASELSIPSPRTFRPETEEELLQAARAVGFPVILKPFSQELWLREDIYAVVGRWRKAYRADGEEDLVRVYRALSEVHREFVVQEYIPGGDDAMFELHAYCPEPGQAAGYFLGRKIRAYPIHFGQGCYVRSWNDDRIARVGLEALEKVGYVGPTNVDLRLDARTGEVSVLEINPRFSVWCHLSSRCGVNLPHAMFCDLTGRPLPRLVQDSRERRFLYFHLDLRSAKDYVAAGEWTWGRWLRSLAFPRITFFRWDLRDPLPWVRASLTYARGKLARPALPLRPLMRAGFGLIPFPWNKGVRFARLCRRFDRTQWRSAEAIEALQLACLRRVVRHAARTAPAYRRKIEEAGFDPFGAFTMEDFRRLPVTTKEEVRSDPDGFRSARPGAAVLTHRTSGSTGTPLSVLSTRESWLAERAVMYRGWRWAGFRPGDRVVTCVGALAGSSSAPVERYRNNLDMSSAHLDPSSIAAYAEEIGAFNPHFLRTYPSIAVILGREIRSRGVPLDSIKAVWTQSETLTPAVREEIEKLFGAVVRDYYGLQEKCAAMSECERGSMHVHADFGLVELIPLGGSDRCRIVATGFFNPAMPLLRYDTGDTAVASEAPCPCGRGLPAVASLEGRLEDDIVTPSGRFITELDHALLSAGNVRECQFVQEAPERVVLRIVPGEGFSDKDESALIRSVSGLLGEDMSLAIEKVRSIDRTGTGKLRFMVSKVRRRI